MSEDSFEAGDYRTLTRVFAVLSVVFWAYILAFIHWRMIPNARFAIVFVGACIVLFVVSELQTSLSEQKYVDAVLLVASGVIAVLVTVHMYFSFQELFFGQRGIGQYFWYEHLGAVLMMFAIVYLSYRAFGKAFVVIAVLGFVYGFYGPLMPGLLNHSGLSITRLTGITVLGIRGIYGNITKIVATWVALFLLYTGLFRGYGGFGLILRSVSWMAKKTPTGIPASAVLASALIGSVNGSPAANTAMTGSITIPIMKKIGIPSETAGGIEASASTSGQVLPPVMGATAFIMASFLGITYFDVIVAGAVPAFLFFISVLIGVYFISVTHLDPGKMSPEQIDNMMTENISKSATEGERGRWLAFDVAQFVLPFVLLVYLLGVARWTVPTAAKVVVLTQIGTGVTFPFIKALLKSDTTANYRSLTVTVLQDTLWGIKDGAKIIASIGIIIALINAFVNIISATALPGVLSLFLLDLSGGTFFLTVLFTMLLCIVFGMGIPSVAAYIIVAILIAPTFTQDFGIAPIVAHYFVFYAVILTYITPPIASAAVIGSGIAGAGFIATAYQAVKISLSLFILPVVFLYNPELIQVQSGLQTIVTVAFVLAGTVIVTFGATYGAVSHYTRLYDSLLRLAIILLGAIVMVVPNFAIRSIPIVIVLAVLLLNGTVSVRRIRGYIP